MRGFLTITLLGTLALGCSKQAPPPVVPEPNEPTVEKKPPADTTASDRAKWLAMLKSKDFKTRQDAADELAEWVKTDPPAIAELLELLKDKSTTGAGKILATRINSVREAAALALSRGGPNGEAALKEKGFALLRDGLNDPDAAIREHTAHTIGQIGRIARPLSADVTKLCTAPDANIRGEAFDALRSIGITDVPGFALLLTNENREVVRLAAELTSTLRDVPASAVPALVAALKDEDSTVRTSVAAALASAGPKAASAAEPLVTAIKMTKSHTGKYDPEMAYESGPEAAYWRALTNIGEPAVAAVTGLLAHENALVRGFAATTLGNIGPPAKASADKLKLALKDTFKFVAVEAACALCRIGEGQTEAVELVKLAIDAPNSVAQTAIDAIPRMGEAGKALIPAALAKLTPDANPYARYAAVGLVGSLPPEEAAAAAGALGKLATDKEQMIRLRVGRVLERLGPNASAAAEALGAALAKEQDLGVRDQFIDALTAMGAGAKPALPALLPLVTDQAVTLAQRLRVIAAVASADPASPEVAAALLSATSDGDPVVRSHAAAGLGKLKPLPADALAKLISLAKTDPRTPPRYAALQAIASAGTQAKGATADLETIAAGPATDMAFRAKVALAAVSGDIGSVAPTVRSGLTDKNAGVRTAAAEALLLIKPTPADSPALIKLLTDKPTAPKEAAARCVGKLGLAAKDAVPALIKLLGEGDADVRIAAVEALGEMGQAALPAVGKLKEMRGNNRRSDQQAGPAAAKVLEKLDINRTPGKPGAK